MRVMTTRVHDTRSARTVGDITFFLDRQRIDIRSHSDDRRPVIGRLNYIRDDTALARCQPMRNPGGSKLFAQIIGCRKFFAAEFGVPMEVTADLREPGQNSGELSLDSP